MLSAAMQEELVNQFSQEGCLDSFGALVSLHEGSIYHFALRMLDCEEQASLVLEDVMVLASKGFTDRVSGESVRVWFFRKAAVAIEERLEIRSQEQLLKLEESWLERALLGAAEGDAYETSINAAMSIAASRLPFEYRQVFLLKDAEKFSYAEIALISGLHMTEVRRRVHRARMMVLRMLRRLTVALFSPEEGAGDESKTPRLAV